jgi:hypothetical protein
MEVATVDYLMRQLETNNPNQAKKALQTLCQFDRRGYRVRPDRIQGLLLVVIGLINSTALAPGNEKLRRWCLNALARFGQMDLCHEAVMHLLKTFPDEPQTVAAAVAALHNMSDEAGTLLKSQNVDAQLMTLAALQHVPAESLDLSPLPINVDHASPDLLKLGLVLVGLDKAPDNLMDPRHNNAQMVRALGTHHDAIVSQYTIWAITENRGLSIGDLGVDIQTFEGQPSNVRSWMLRLAASQAARDGLLREIVVEGAGDPDPEARLGLAIGLLDTYYDGLDAVVLDWFTGEDDEDVTIALLDHIVHNAEQSTDYERTAIEEFQGAAPHSLARLRMQSAAVGRPIHARFQKINYAVDGDLFGEARTVVNNIKGDVNAGVISFGNGTATNSGNTTMNKGAEVKEILALLSQVEREINASPLTDDMKAEGLDAVKAAQADPKPGMLERTLKWLKRAETAGEIVHAGYDAFEKSRPVLEALVSTPQS